MDQPIVISHFQVGHLLTCRESGNTQTYCSPDLGLTNAEVKLDSDGARFSQKIFLDWDALQEICSSRNNCFLIENGAPKKIAAFSEFTNRVYSLMPTEKAPTLLVSGTPMHRIKGTNPSEDTFAKMQTIAPVAGHVLDTTTGLGYTAIEAAKTAESVISIELDSAVLEIAGLNPWSRALLESPKIIQKHGDSFELIRKFRDQQFDRIIHDPPMFQLAGSLYGIEFYTQLHRVLAPGGRLFHYVGNPESPSGSRTTPGVVRRLKDAGFSKIVPQPRAFGLTAWK